MKNQNYFIVFVFCCLSSFLFGQNAWERITPTPQEHSINDMCKIPGTDKIMAVCEGSAYMITTDMGQNWEIFNNPAGLTNGCDLLCVYFLNGSVGFIGSGSGIVLKTNNGGETWQMINEPCAKSGGIKSIEFANDNIGFALDEYWGIFKTFNVGETWDSYELSFEYEPIDIAFADNSTGFMVGGSVDSIAKTINGGQTWNLVAFPGGFNYGNLTGIYFVNESVGFITAQENGTSLNFGRIYKTVDAGETWTEVYNDFWNMPVDIHFIDENTGIVGCSRIMYESSTLITHDAGVSWSESIFAECSSYGAGAVLCNTDNSFMAAGNMGFTFANDGTGNGWEFLHDRVFSGDILYTQFFDEENIFAYAKEGLGGVLTYGLWKSNNGGLDWNYLNVTLTRAVFDFISPDIGFMVDLDDGYYRVSKTINGGVDWSELTTIPDYTYEPSWCNFKDELNGIFSDGNTIFVTDDGANTWIENGIPGPLLLDAEYIGENRIIMLANDWDQTYIYTSNDNGTSWEDPVVISWTYVSEFYTDDFGTIYIPGLNSILKSTDEGATWIETTINGSDMFFNSMHFPTLEIGYAVGGGPYNSIFKSTNGGETWNELDIPSTSSIYHVHFFNEEYGLVFGENGLVMKTTSGGTVGFEEISENNASHSIHIFPNPVSDNFYINTQGFDKVELFIYNQTGKLVYTKQITSITEKIKIDCGFLSPGIYFIQLNNGAENIKNKKIIKL